MRGLLIVMLTVALCGSTAAHYFTVLAVPPEGGRAGATYIIDREAPLSWIETPDTACARALPFADRTTCTRAMTATAESRSKTPALPWLPGLDTLAISPPPRPDAPEILRRLNQRTP